MAVIIITVLVYNLIIDDSNIWVWTTIRDAQSFTRRSSKVDSKSEDMSGYSGKDSVRLLKGNQKPRGEGRKVGSGPSECLGSYICYPVYWLFASKCNAMHLHLCVQKAEFLCTQHNTKRGDQKVVSFRIMIISPSYGKQEVEVLKTRRSTAVFLPFVWCRSL